MNHTSFGYTRAYIGDSTQLTYLRSRFYASSTGRFLTRDTWGGDANNPMSYNKWNYVSSNPANHTDPIGLCEGKSDDINNFDIACWNMISQIEKQFTNVHIKSQDRWVYNELLAVIKALSDFGFGKQVATAPAINFYRQEYGGSGRAGLTEPSDDGIGYKITMYSYAQFIETDTNGSSNDGTPQQFEGAIVHELAHVAMDQDPSILESYKNALSVNNSYSFVGHAYDKSSCFTAIPPDPDCVNKEMIAITAEAYQFSPNSFFNFWGGSDWRFEWFQSRASLNPFADMCYGPYK